MADAEQKHRHTIESGQMFLNQEGVRLMARDSLTGMLLGALVALSGMAGAAWQARHGCILPMRRGRFRRPF